MMKTDKHNKTGSYREDFLMQTVAPGTRCNSAHMALSAGVSLLVTIFDPPDHSVYPPLVLIPGLLSGMENFMPVLQELSRDFRIYFVETREKRTSHCSTGSDFSIPVMAQDLAEMITLLGLKEKQFMLLGFSMGASVSIEACIRLHEKPLAMVLIGPTSSFHFPRWSGWLTRIAAPIFGVLKPFLKCYIKHRHVNHKEDAEMQQILIRVLDGADPFKLCSVIRAIADYTVWARVGEVEVPVLVIGASKDTLHSHDDALRLASTVKNGRFIDLETNARHHGAEVAGVIREFLGNMELTAENAKNHEGIQEVFQGSE